MGSADGVRQRTASNRRYLVPLPKIQPEMTQSEMTMSPEPGLEPGVPNPGPSLRLAPVPRYDELSATDFRRSFLEPRQPVVMRSFAAGWPALARWRCNELARAYGALRVPVVAEAFANSGRGYTAADRYLRFDQYLGAIQREPSRLRMFLFNVRRRLPELCKDFDYPDHARRWARSRPYLFFGGTTASVDVHYDADLAHVFLTQFEGRKRVLLFGPEHSLDLYRHPLTVSCNVDVTNPDFERYPRLALVQGYECLLDHGDTLFIPSGWWHSIDYLESGFSLSLRSFELRPGRRLRGLGQVLSLALDAGITRLLGAARWYAAKERMAQDRAARAGNRAGNLL